MFQSGIFSRFKSIASSFKKPRFRFKVIRGSNEIRSLSVLWQQLSLLSAVQHYFHCVEWFLSLVETYEQYNEHNYFFVVIYDSSELVGIIPLYSEEIIVKGVRLKALKLLSNVRRTPATRDIILSRSVANSNIMEELLEFLNHLDRQWEIIELFGVLEDSCAAIIACTSSLPHLTTPGGAAGKVTFISCGANDAPFARLSKSFRQNLRTSNNKLNPETCFVHACETQSLKELYPLVSAVEASGWKKTENAAISNNPSFDTFLCKLIDRLGPSAGCEIHLMKMSDLVIGGVFGVIYNDVFFIHTIAYSEEYYQLSPGHLLLEHIIKIRGANGKINAITTYHAPPWFDSWKPDRTLQLSNIYFFRPTKNGTDLHDKLLTINQVE